MAIIDLTLEKPAIRRTEIIQEGSSEDDDGTVDEEATTELEIEGEQRRDSTSEESETLTEEHEEPSPRRSRLKVLLVTGLAVGAVAALRRRFR